jgi:hypothetical protein
VVELHVGPGYRFFQQYSPQEVNTAMLQANMSPMSTNSYKNAVGVSLSRYWERLVAVPARTEIFVTTNAIRTTLHPHLFEAHPYAVGTDWVFKSHSLKGVIPRDRSSTTSIFRCMAGETTHLLEKVDAVEDGGKTLQSVYILTREGGGSEPECVSRRWECLVPQDSKVEVLHGADETLCDGIRHSLLDGFPHFPQLCSVSFRVQGKKFLSLSDALSYDRVLSAHWYEALEGLMHEYILLDLGRNIGDTWQRTMSLRFERDKTSWLAIWSKNLTDEYIQVGRIADPLIDIPSRCRYLLEVKEGTADDRRPNVQALMEIMEGISHRSPYYRLFSRNCWWYASLFFDELRDRIGFLNYEIRRLPKIAKKPARYAYSTSLYYILPTLGLVAAFFYSALRR